MPYFLEILLVALLGGSIPTFAKFALETIPTFSLVFIRFSTASVALLPFVIKNDDLSFKSFKKYMLVSLAGALNPILLFIALKFTQASVSPLIYAATPLFTALYFLFTKQEKVSKQTLRGIFIGLIGVVTIVLMPLISTNSNQQLSFGGNLLIFLAMLAFTSYGILSKNEQEKSEASPVTLTFYFSLLTMIISLPFVIQEWLTNQIVLNQIKSLHWLAAVAIGVLGTTVNYLLYQDIIKKDGATAASLFTYLQPVVGIILPILVLGETISLPFIVGGILAIIGVQQATKK